MRSASNETVRTGAHDADTDLTITMERPTMTATFAPTVSDRDPASAIAILPTVSNPAPPPLLSAPIALAERPSPAPAVVPRPREPGIYFALPEADYHADPSLGSTDLKRLLRSPTDYWWASHMNPSRPDNPGDTADKQKGRALHKLILEGMKGFEKAFIPAVRKENWPGALDTVKELEDFLRGRGEKITKGEVKAALIKRVKALDAKVLIWADIVANFEAMAKRDGLEILKADAMEEVTQAATMVALNPHLANAFIDGVPEVSVFWRDADGVPCKCRFDYLKPRTIADLKKCANKAEHPFADACRLAFQAYRYDIQVAHYLEEGYPEFLRFADEGRIFGPCPLPTGFSERMAPPQFMTWTLIFHQTGGAPVTAGFQIGVGAPVLARARVDVTAAKKVWRDCMAIYGTDMWVSDAPIREFGLHELPYQFRMAAEQEAA